MDASIAEESLFGFLYLVENEAELDLILNPEADTNHNEVHQYLKQVPETILDLSCLIYTDKSVIPVFILELFDHIATDEYLNEKSSIAEYLDHQKDYLE